MILNYKELADTFKNLLVTVNDVDKAPGVLLNITDGEMTLNYTDGKLAYTDKLEVTNEDGDETGKIVLNLSQLKRVITNCSPSAGITTGDFHMNFNKEDGVISIECEQGTVGTIQEDGKEAVTEFKKCATKKSDIGYKVFDETDRIMSILGRADYDSIVAAEGVKVDTWDRKELQRIMNVMSKSDNASQPVYFSSKVQHVYALTNQYTVAFRLKELKEYTEEELNAERTRLLAQGVSPDEVNKSLAVLGKQQTYQLITPVSMAKLAATLLGGMKDEKVRMYAQDGFLRITNLDGTMGCQLTTGKKQQNASAFDSYRSMDYTRVQVNVERIFFADMIKTATNNSGTDSLPLIFEKVGEEDGKPLYKLVFNVVDKARNIRDKVDVEVLGYNSSDALADTSAEGYKPAIEQVKCQVSLKVLNQAVSFLQDEYVSLDFTNVTETNSSTLRLGEFSEEDLLGALEKKAKELGKSIESLDEFDKMDARAGYLNTTFYIMCTEK